MNKEEIEQYEQAEKLVLAENVGLLAAFKNWLIAKKTTPKMVEKHIINIKIYMDYLLRYDTFSSKYYEDTIGFLWFYDDKVWGGNCKTAYTSLKKYYDFLYENKLADDAIMAEVAAGKTYFY